MKSAPSRIFGGGWAHGARKQNATQWTNYTALTSWQLKKTKKKKVVVNRVGYFLVHLATVIIATVTVTYITEVFTTEFFITPQTRRPTAYPHHKTIIISLSYPVLCSSVITGWLGSRVVSVLDSSAEGPGFKSQSRRCRVTVLGKLFTPIVSLFTKQQNW